MIAGRFRALRSAVGLAYDDRIIDHHPIRNMRGPGRMNLAGLSDGDLRAVLWTAEANLLAAIANDNGNRRSAQRRRSAEQDLLLVLLAADSGARRGELAALQFADLDGSVLRIERSVSADVLSPVQARRLRVRVRAAGPCGRNRHDGHSGCALGVELGVPPVPTRWVVCSSIGCWRWLGELRRDHDERPTPSQLTDDPIPVAPCLEAAMGTTRLSHEGVGNGGEFAVGLGIILSVRLSTFAVGLVRPGDSLRALQGGGYRC